MNNENGISLTPLSSKSIQPATYYKQTIINIHAHTFWVHVLKLFTLSKHVNDGPVIYTCTLLLYHYTKIAVASSMPFMLYMEQTNIRA